MITEDYVSLEIAKLLKECGFHFPIYVFIGEDGKKRFSDRRDDWNNTEWDDGKTYSCPTMQMAMKWLREKHNIFITTQFGWFHGDYQYEASVVKMNPVVPPTTDSIEYIKSFREDTIEEAIMKAIRCALVRLVKKV